MWNWLRRKTEEPTVTVAEVRDSVSFVNRPEGTHLPIGRLLRNVFWDNDHDYLVFVYDGYTLKIRTNDTKNDVIVLVQDVE